MTDYRKTSAQAFKDYSAHKGTTADLSLKDFLAGWNASHSNKPKASVVHTGYHDFYLTIRSPIFDTEEDAKKWAIENGYGLERW